MLTKKPLIIALCMLSTVALAHTSAQKKTTSEKVTAHQKDKQHAAAHKKAKQLTNENPEQIKEQIAILKSRLASMSNNSNQPKAGPKWYDHFALSGLVNVDGSYHSRPYFGVGNRQTSASSYLGLATANLAGSAHFGNWVSGRISLLYQNGTSPEIRNADTYINANKHVRVDQGYITIANFAKTPYFLRVGQQYAPFGRYKRYPLVNTLPQVLSQTDAPIAQLGFVTLNGFYGSVYALSGENKINHSNNVQIGNGGFAIGFKRMIKQMSFDIGAAYILNMADVDSIRTIINDKHGYIDRVPGVSAYLNVYAGPFEFGVQEVAATKRFSVSEYAYNNNRTQKVGAKPSAGDAHAEYSFLTFSRHSNINLSYQWSSEAHNTAIGVLPTSPTALPKKRLSATYGIGLLKHLAGYLQYYRDYDYKQDHGGTDKIDNVVMLRLSLMM